MFLDMTTLDNLNVNKWKLDNIQEIQLAFTTEPEMM